MICAHTRIFTEFHRGKQFFAAHEGWKLPNEKFTLPFDASV